jgi:biopolymer transport protein ExbB/TolQ
MHGFTAREIIANGWPILSILMIMSALSITTIVDRLVMFRKTKRHIRIVSQRLGLVAQQRGKAAVLAELAGGQSTVLTLIGAALSAEPDSVALDNALRRHMKDQLRQLEFMMPALGTIASTAPFVGLFGTVIGIMKAFGDIAASSGGGPEVVAAGIAEALITTAAGLAVAIPAVMGYNYCVNQVRQITEDIDAVAYDLVRAVQKGRPA